MTTTTTTTEPAMGSLAERAMLARLSITQWTSRRLDKPLTNTVQEEHALAADAGKWNKNLISPDALKKVQAIANAARAEHYRLTLPWMDDGSRILPVRAFDTYRETLHRYENQFQVEVRDFCDRYPILVDEARARLNGTFNPKDYPSDDRISRKFTYEVKYGPLPTGDDFRAALDSHELARIRRLVDDSTCSAVQAGMMDAWTRLHDAISRAFERLSTADAKFHDTLIGNIRDVCGVLPLLNITDDCNLEAFRIDALARLAALDPETLRKYPQERATAADDAKRIMNKMAEFM
jgi:hypothetical protein